MRVLITKPMCGVLDGKPLGRLTPGQTYEVKDPIGLQLVAFGGAKEQESRERRKNHRVDDEAMNEAQLYGGVHILRKDTADDRPKRHRSRRR